MYRKTSAALAAALLVACSLGAVAQPAADPLPSWKDGPTKKAILDYVAAVTKRGGPDYIPPEDRIATFDNDGTLWCEKPTVEIVFTLEKLKALAAKDPALKEKQPFKAALEGDHDYFHAAGMKAVLEVVAATHGDMAQEQFDAEARAFFKSAKHPKFGVPYPQMAYTPMVEVLRYLRANGFQTWICSGGFMDLMRAFTQDAYGIPPQQVIGSSMKKKSLEKDGKRILWLLSQLLCICDQDDKPVEIGLHIGKRPVFAAGNVRSSGDVAMLRYCQGSKYKSLQLMVNHDDAEREYAYAEKDRASLNAAEKHGWHVVSMKNDWKTVFAFGKGPAAGKLPEALIGKWVVEGGEQDGATFEFYREGTMLGRINVQGKEGIIKARVRVEEKTLLITTVNPFTQKDETRKQTIKTLTKVDLVLEDEIQVIKMKRLN